MEPRYRRNLNVLLPCFVVLGIMLGLVAYSPEIYREFCSATGYGGTTQRAYTDLCHHVEEDGNRCVRQQCRAGTCHGASNRNSAP